MTENPLELVVKIVMVEYNRGKDETLDILERSEKLRGYSTLLAYVKQYRDEGFELKASIDRVVRRCISEQVLRNFLERNRPEVKRMLFSEITSEEFAEIRAKEAATEAAAELYEKGMKKGMKKGIAGLIETCQEFSLSKEDTLIKVRDKFSLSEESAEEYIKEFWRG